MSRATKGVHHYLAFCGYFKLFQLKMGQKVSQCLIIEIL